MRNCLRKIDQMYILDSDHLSILQRQKGQECEILARRCSAIEPVDFFVGETKG